MEDYRLEQSGQEVQDILNGAAMQSDLTAETERAELAETTLQGNIDIEERDRKDADLTLQGNIDAEELRAKAAEKQNADDIDALEEKVPSGASSSNKLATEEYVNDSVATATAIFRGTYNLVSDLHLTVNATEQQIATALALAISTADNNDYCFVQVPTSSETPTEIKEIDRYKFNRTAWSFEYKLNNSGFTAAQWAAINSGITSGDVTKLAALPTNAELTTLLNGKQDVLTFDNVPTEGSSHPVKSGGVYSAIDDEKTARENADSSLSSAIEAILLLIPSAATSLNKLADKAFVNSSIATASATFRGTYNLVTDLSLTVSATHAQIATALAGAVSDEDNNDYAFVQIPTSDATPTQIAKTERYKFNGTAWEYEYDLNNSGYTAAQWAAINSGITEALVTKLSALPTNAELTSALGVLTSSITAINQKIPSAASQANQLVDTAAMESYIVQVLDVLTASFNVTSTDGHVTVSISQVDGKITSVSVSTSDIASAASLSLVAGRVTTAEGNISTNAADIANLQDAYAALTQSALVVVQPTDTWPVASPATSTIYRVVDRVNTPPKNYSDYMWNGTAMVLMATYDNAIDDVPTPGSNNLVKSGGVYKYLESLQIVVTPTSQIVGEHAFISVQNKWLCYPELYGIFIPIKGNVSYSIKANASITSLIAFLTTNEYIENQNVAYATGASRTVLNPNRVISGMTPADATYIYVCIESNGASWAPSELIIDGYDYEKGILESLKEKASMVSLKDGLENTSLLVPINNMIHVNAWMVAGTDKWMEGSGFDGVLIKINAGDKVRLYRPEAISAAFLTSDVIKDGMPIQFATVGRLRNRYEETAPSDAKFLFVGIRNNSTDFTPPYFRINNVSYKKTYIEFLTEGKQVEVNLSDYTNLRECLSSILPDKYENYIINIPEGEYDIKSYYTTEEIADEDFKGLFVPNYVTLRGIGRKENTILKWYNDDNDQSTEISTLNLMNVAGLENLTINSRNIRYSVHDDWAQQGSPDRKYCFNIDVNHYNGAYRSAWGAGQKGNQVAKFINCNFYTDQNNKAFSSHNNVDVTEASFIEFENCKFNNEGSWQAIGFGSLTNNTNVLTYVTLKGCRVKNGIRLSEENASLYGMGIRYKVNGYSNNIGNADVLIQNTDSVDYSSYIDLWAKITE